MALQNIDNLLAVFSCKHTIQKNDENDNVFTSSKIPMSTYIKIWSYLLNTTPIPDNLVLTSTLFRDITYNHPIFISSFHIRLDPLFRFNKNNYNKFQIGTNITMATRKAIIINNVENIISNKDNIIFPFHSIKIFNITRMSTKSEVIPCLNVFAKSIKCMTWNINNFGSNDDEKDEIPIIPQCQLFALATSGIWNNSIKLDYKFTALNWFNFALDDTRIKWNKDIFDKLQLFLLSMEDTLSIFVLDLNLKNISINNDEYNKDNPFTLILPSNIEIVVLNCMNRERAETICIDFSECRHHLKQIVLLNNSLIYVKKLLFDGKGANNLNYFVINDRNDVNELTNNLLIEKPNLFKNTKIDRIYTPCIPKFGFSNKELNEINGIQCIDSFPDLESVKDIIENHNVRKLFRNLNCEERRHWLWCIFWYDINGKGLRKLHELEAKWKEDIINDDL